MLVERVLVRARDKLVGVVALQLHAQHARQGMRLAAKGDDSHSNFFADTTRATRQY